MVDASTSFTNVPTGSAAAGAEPGKPAHPDLMPESFTAVVLRRFRYTAAILLSALLFCTLGWQVAQPPAQMAGVSLLAWQNGAVAGAGGALFAALFLAVMLLVATAVSSVLVHPESPHMGLFCALLGMAGLSIRGGTIHMLVENAQQSEIFPRVSQMLAIECVQWALVLLIAEVFCRLLHDRFFANTHWITRGAPELAARSVDEMKPAEARQVTQDGKALPMSPAAYWMGVVVAVVISMGLAGVLLYVLLQSQAKGQVLMSCFVAFFLSTMAAYLVVPRVPMLPMLLTVLGTACAGYLYGMNMRPIYPGHSGFFATRALPIDYVTAGVPGAILGYYTAFRWSINPPEVV